LSTRDTYARYADGSDKYRYKKEYTGGFALDYLDFDLIDKHSLSIGGDYRNQGTPDNKDFYAITALFIQDVWSIADPVTLTFGTRWYEFATDSYEFGDLSKKTRRIEKEWCPKARLDYEFDDGLSLYASVSREMRMP
jgi:outer membrane receptor protein involved in Fe transport